MVHVIESMVPMPADRILDQPVEVWLRVEEMIAHGWQFNAAAAIREVEGDKGAFMPAPGTGWLHVRYFEGLLARDVAVTRMFTLAALERRRDMH